MFPSPIAPPIDASRKVRPELQRRAEVSCFMFCVMRYLLLLKAARIMPHGPRAGVGCVRGAQGGDSTLHAFNEFLARIVQVKEGIPGFKGQFQRRLASCIDSVHIRAVLKQRFDSVQSGEPMQWGPSPVVNGSHIRAGFQQDAYDSCAPGPMQRRGVALVSCVRVRSRLQTSLYVGGSGRTEEFVRIPGSAILNRRRRYG